jgi:hypothetical protein
MYVRMPCWSALATTALLLFACVSAPRHEYRIAEAHEGATGVHRVFLAPMNAHIAFPDELADGAERTHEQVRQYLSAHGKTMLSSSPSYCQRVMRHALDFPTVGHDLKQVRNLI